MVLADVSVGASAGDGDPLIGIDREAGLLEEGRLARTHDRLVSQPLRTHPTAKQLPLMHEPHG